MAAFLRAWAGAEADGAAAAALAARAEEHERAAGAVAAAMAARLWHWEGDGRGWWRAFDVKGGAPVAARTYQLAWPAWEGIGSPEQVAACLRELLAPDMRGAAGIRSTSAADPRFSLEDAIVPYSIWRGPVWVNVNCCLCYALARGGLKAEALGVARGLVAALAADVRANGAMHECYHPDTGAPTCTASKVRREPLRAPKKPRPPKTKPNPNPTTPVTLPKPSLTKQGFLSWNMMAASILENLEAGVDPTAL